MDAELGVIDTIIVLVNVVCEVETTASILSSNQLFAASIQALLVPASVIGGEAKNLQSSFITNLPYRLQAYHWRRVMELFEQVVSQARCFQNVITNDSYAGARYLS